MFEFEQEIVNSLLQENDDFKRLYDKHAVLKDKIEDANLGSLSIDDLVLEQLKKEKLLLKDRMAGMIKSYQRAQA